MVLFYIIFVWEGYHGDVRIEAKDFASDLVGLPSLTKSSQIKGDQAKHVMGMFSALSDTQDNLFCVQLRVLAKPN